MTDQTLAVVETEAALLGAMMIDNRLIEQLGARLKPEHFYSPLHQRMFKVMLKLVATDTAATPVTLRPYFEKDPYMAEAGGPAYMAGLTGSGAGLLGAPTFADQIKQFAQYRQAVDVLQGAIGKIMAVNDKPDTWADYFDADLPVLSDIVTETASEMFGITEDESASRVIKVSTLLGRVRERHMRARNGSSIGAKCATISDLNDLIGAAAAEQMTMIGGRSGMGKSVLAQSAAWGYALNGHPTLMISLEMSEDAQAMRQSADLTFGMNEPVSFKRITRDKLDESDLKTIDEAARRVSALPLYMIAPGRKTIEEIEGIIARHAARLERAGTPLEVVFIDYAQIVAASGKKEGRERIDHISERCLAIAKRFKCHVFLLSQLVRDIDKRVDKRPTSADLKESGRLEEDADNVVLVYRPEYYLRREEPKRDDGRKWEEWDIEFQSAQGRVDLIADKTRMGEPGTRRARFYGDSQAIRGSDFQLPDFVDENPLLPRHLAESILAGP